MPDDTRRRHNARCIEPASTYHCRCRRRAQTAALSTTWVAPMLGTNHLGRSGGRSRVLTRVSMCQNQTNPSADFSPIKTTLMPSRAFQTVSLERRFLKDGHSCGKMACVVAVVAVVAVAACCLLLAACCSRLVCCLLFVVCCSLFVLDADLDDRCVWPQRTTTLQ